MTSSRRNVLLQRCRLGHGGIQPSEGLCIIHSSMALPLNSDLVYFNLIYNQQALCHAF